MLFEIRSYHYDQNQFEAYMMWLNEFVHLAGC